MKTIALIAVNEDCYEREKIMKDFVQKQLAKNHINVLKFNTHQISEMVKEAKKEADKTFIVFDAKEGRNATFSYAAAELYKQNLKPVLIVSNSDAEDANVEYAKNALAEIWSMKNPELETWDLDFDNIYFSYEKMGFDTMPEVTETGIQALIDAIERD